MSSFYGINAARSATTGLPLFTPGGGFKNALLTVTACYQLSHNWSVGAQVGYMRLLGQAAKSPTNEDNEVENLVTGFQFQYKLPDLSNKKFRNLLQPACSSS
jgi:outer membrane scaffolding protein for murein synthesis (MipA/OmpV family)